MVDVKICKGCLYWSGRCCDYIGLHRGKSRTKLGVLSGECDVFKPRPVGVPKSAPMSARINRDIVRRTRYAIYKKNARDEWRKEPSNQE